MFSVSLGESFINLNLVLLKLYILDEIKWNHLKILTIIYEQKEGCDYEHCILTGFVAGSEPCSHSETYEVYINYGDPDIFC